MSTRLFEGMIVQPLFINIELGLNAINGYHPAMVTIHDVGILHIDCKHH